MGKKSHAVKVRACLKCKGEIETDSKGLKKHAKVCKG